MGSFKLELGSKNAETTEKAQEIQDNAERRIEDAENNAEIFPEFEAADDETAEAVEEGKEKAAEINKELAQSEIVIPGEEISEMYEETYNEAMERSEQEMKNSDIADGMTAAYSEVGAEISSKFQESGQEFNEIADEADKEKNEMITKCEQAAAELEGVI